MLLSLSREGFRMSALAFYVDVVKTNRGLSNLDE